MTTVEARIAALAGLLTRQGELTDEKWRSALHAVPRHHFIPDTAWVTPYEGDRYRIDRTADEEHWLDAVYSDASVITQFSDGAGDPESGDGCYSSSSSAPGVLMEFLHLLNPYIGDDVLEIGTGTGWTAALLSYRFGDDAVTSIEVDPAVAAAAAASLKAAGYTPNLIVGDGSAGCPEEAPFDRVHVTCGVAEIPYAWVEQTRPGGLIAVPWMPAYEGGHKLTLTVVGDGSAVGRFHGGCSYMMLRAQRPSRLNVEGSGGWRESTTDLDPRRVWRAGYGFDVAAAGMLPGVTADVVEDEDGTSFTLWLWSGDSQASVTYVPCHAVGVRQAGPRDLWDELVGVYRWWLLAGSPTRDRFGLTVARDGQRVWLDSPANVLRSDA